MEETTMRMALAGALAGAAALMGTPSLAQPPPGAGAVTHVETVRDLAAVCDPQWGGMPRLEAIAYCQGFLTAAGQYHALMHPAGGPIRPLFCLPRPGPTIAESGVDFAQWARATPRFSGEPALDGFLRWAQARYPCPAQPAGRPMRPSR
jgi:hypothetical protein